MREAAKREGRDRKRPGIEHGSLRSEHGEGYEFVQHHARPEEIADGGTVAPWDSDDPRDGSKQHSEDLLQAGRKPHYSEAVVKAAQHALGEGDQREERTQHGGGI